MTTENKTTALKALCAAHEQALTQDLTAEMHILAAASIYAEDHPEWFTQWDQHDSASKGLDAASWASQHSTDPGFTATFALIAAASVATHHPHLFVVSQSQPSAEIDLEQMYDVAYVDSVEQALMWAALQYARQRPEWFATWHTYTHPDVALQAAADKAKRAHDKPAFAVLRAASEVIASNRYLHGVDRQNKESDKQE